MVVFSYTEVVWKVTEQKIYFVVFVLFSKYLVQVFSYDCGELSGYILSHILLQKSSLNFCVCKALLRQQTSVHQISTPLC